MHRLQCIKALHSVNSKGESSMSKIYVSSTYLDLQDYRAQVERVIRRMGDEDVAME